MLFGYPIAATAENWLHDCLRETLQEIHTCAEPPQTALPVWPEIIPKLYRDRLNKRHRLRKNLEDYYTSLKDLTPSERGRTLQALEDQNKISPLLSCHHNCESIQELPETIREPIANLFTYAFDILTELEIRDNHYYSIYETTSYHVCPFCGCEYFDAPGAPREALDHYLPKDKYPFAASNLRNLVPMGNKCNSRHKLAQDILKKDDGTRRKSFDPYDHEGINISLDRSQPFGGTVGNIGEQLPKWEIDFFPKSEEIVTWNDVFHIGQRYRRDVLDEGFNSWLKGFRAWCRDPRRNQATSDQEWVDELEGYAIYHESLEFNDRAFLKAAVFRMLHTHCKNGNQRLLNFIKNVVMM